MANPTASSVNIAGQLPSVTSTRTVRRRLLVDFQLASRRPAKKAKLSAKNIKDRVAFCRKYRMWRKEDWMKVMFSDESTFSQFATSTKLVRRPKNQRYNTRYVVPTVKNAPTVMVWGSFSGRGRGGIWFMPKNMTINGTVYLGILKDKLQPRMNINACTIFQQDGAPCHQARAVKQWLHQQGIEIVGPWPGSSPDLNPIENLWNTMKRLVAQHKPTSEQCLINAIKHVWTNEITPAYCESLVSSMPARVKAVLDNKGRYTKY